MIPPIKNYLHTSYPKGSVTQWFGENIPLYAKLNIGLVKGHNGVDIVAPWGTPIYAVEGGIVAEVKYSDTGFGKHVRVLHKFEDGLFHEWTYGHLSDINVVVGQLVEEGKQLGLMGNTGFVVSGSTPYWKFNPYAGTHLHLGLRVLKEDRDGWQYFGGVPKCIVVDQANGFLGCIDPEPYLKQAVIDTISTQLTSIELTLKSIVNSFKSIFKV